MLDGIDDGDLADGFQRDVSFGSVGKKGDRSRTRTNVEVLEDFGLGGIDDEDAALFLGCDVDECAVRGECDAFGFARDGERLEDFLGRDVNDAGEGGVFVRET